MMWPALYLFLSLSLQSQLGAHRSDPAERYTDSLLRLARNAPTDSIRIERFLELSFFWCDRDTARAFRYIRDARRQMGKKPTAYQQGLLHHFTANVIYTYDMERAKAAYLLADRYLSAYRFPQAYLVRSKAWANYGTLLQRQDSASRFLEVLIDKALPYARLAGDSVAVGNNLQNMALLLSNIQDFRKAGAYYQQATQALSGVADRHGDKLTLFVNAAKNALLDSNLMQAGTLLDSAATQLAYLPYANYAPQYHCVAGSYYRRIKQTDTALDHFRKGIQAAESLLDEYTLRDLHFEIYALYRDVGQYADAKRHLTLSGQYHPMTTAYNRLVHLREMAYIEHKLGNDAAAYERMVEYEAAKDTFQENNMALKILDLEKEYQTIEKENEILKLRDTNQRQQIDIDRTRLWVTLLAAGSAITLLIAYFSWRIARSNRRALAQHALLHQKELDSRKQQEQIIQFRSFLQGQEEERNRIARDLHDGLGGMLAGVKLRLSAITSREEERSGRPNIQVNAVIHELDRSVDELRRIARNMMPESLLYMGLQPALADLCNYMDSPQTTVKFQPIGLRDTYPQPMLIGVYRIVQELVNNAIKHAGATQVIVQCSEDEERLVLTVEDNGGGFDQREALHAGLGMANIRNRVVLLQGRLEIDSAPGQGTTINIEIPI